MRFFSNLKRLLRSKKTTLVFFIATTLVVVCYYAFHRFAPSPINEGILISIWGAFYASCLSVIIFGCAESHALEGVVYVITIVAEAVLPGLWVHLMCTLHLNTPQYPEPVLEAISHLLLTLMACVLLLGWGGVLAFQFMGKGGVPVWARLYVLGAIVAGIGVLLYAILGTESFVGLSAVRAKVYIRSIYPYMYDIPMSYMRIILTLITMFLPWVRTQMDGHKPVSMRPSMDACVLVDSQS